MNTQYQHALVSSIEPDIAWKALAQMNEWLPTLDTVESVTSVGEGPFFLPGRLYLVKTPEGITMQATIMSIREDARSVVIEAQAGPLHSILTCTVGEHSDGCILSRSQNYPGIVGWVFTRVKGKREENETRTYLEVWETYARTLV